MGPARISLALAGLSSLVFSSALSEATGPVAQPWRPTDDNISGWDSSLPPDGPWEPLFDDPIFLAKLVRFLAAFAARYPVTPTEFELEHSGKVKQLGDWDVRPDSPATTFGQVKTGPDFLRGALELLHATSIDHQGDARKWLNDNPALTVERLNRCGYWLFSVAIGVPATLVAGTTAPLRLPLENRAVAPPDQTDELRVRLAGDRASWVGVVGRRDRTWLSGARIVWQDQPALPAELKSGRHAVSLGRFDSSSAKDRPVELALQAIRPEADGYDQITEVEVTSAANPS